MSGRDRSRSESRKPSVFTLRGPAELRSIIGSRLQELDEFVASELHRLSSSMKSLQEENSALREQLGIDPMGPKARPEREDSDSSAGRYRTYQQDGLYEPLPAPSSRSKWGSSDKWRSQGIGAGILDSSPMEDLQTYSDRGSTAVVAEESPANDPLQVPARNLFRSAFKPKGDENPLVETDAAPGDTDQTFHQTASASLSDVQRVRSVIFQERNMGDVDSQPRESATMKNAKMLKGLAAVSPQEEQMTGYNSGMSASGTSSSGPSRYPSAFGFRDSNKSIVTANSDMTAVTVLSRLQSGDSTGVQDIGRGESDADERPRAPRRARQWTTATKTFSALPTWKLDTWHSASRSSTMSQTAVGFGNTDSNFRKVVRMLSEKEKTKHGLLSKREYCLCLQNRMISPMSRTSMAIDILAVTLIACDCVAVPLQLLKASDATESTAFRVMTWISRVFWTTAIPRGFCTGFMRDDGSIEMNFHRVAQEYRNSWLFLDVFIVFCDWLQVVDPSSQSGATKIIRLLKGARLARMVRVPNMIVRKMNHAKSERMQLWLSIVKSTITFLLLNHFLACIWYFVGTIDEPHGWVFEVERNDKSRGVEQAPVEVKYAYSLHWSASQFIGSSEVFPHSLVERCFGAGIMLFAFIWSASFISQITAAMTRLQILSGQKGMLFSSLRQFLSNHGISEQLHMRVLASAKYLVAEKEKNQSEADIELLKLLSEPMLIEVHYEVHSGVLVRHPFFWRYNYYEPLAIQKLCHSAITMLKLAVGDVLFAQGEEPTDPRMFFVENGVCLYIKDFDGDGNIDFDEMVEVANPMWVCEPVLWMRWTHMGTLRAGTNCSVLAISAVTFQKTVTEYRNTSYPALYATQLVSMMNLAFESGEVDDLCEHIDTKAIVHRVFPHFLANKRTYFGNSSHSSVLHRSLSNVGAVLRRSHSSLELLEKNPVSRWWNRRKLNRSRSRELERSRSRDFGAERSSDYGVERSESTTGEVSAYYDGLPAASASGRSLEEVVQSHQSNQSSI